MKTSSHGTTLALAWSQCLAAQGTPRPLSQPRHELWWRKQEDMVKNSNIETKHPARVAGGNAKLKAVARS